MRGRWIATSGLAGLLLAGWLAAAAAGAAPRAGQAYGPLLLSRVEHAFELAYPHTKPGQSVFITGDIPELGGGRPELSVKLEPSEFPLWRLTISVPAGTGFRYQYLLRDDAPGRLSDPSNGAPISGELAGRAAARELPPHHRLVSIARPTEFRRVEVLDPAGRVRTAADLLPSGERLAATALPFQIGDSLRFRGPGGGAGVTRRACAQQLYLAGDLQRGWWTLPPSGELSGSRVEIHENVPSELLGIARNIRVYLPRGYDDQPARRYPVLYLHDGQNVFQPGGPFGCWEVERTLDELIGAGEIPELIVAAIDNAGSLRMQEYLPPYSEIEGQAGTGDRYARYLVEEVAALVDGRYRTLAERDQRLIGGSSLGGLISAYMAWSHPRFASRFICMSGSFWLDGIIDQFSREPPRDVAIYLDSGDQGRTRDSLPYVLQARDALLAGGKYVLGATLHHRVAYGHGHSESFWKQRFGDALRAVFDGRELAVRDGDVDGDGTADERDAELVAAIAAGRSTLSPLAEPRADLDGSGRVDGDDVERAGQQLVPIAVE